MRRAVAGLAAVVTAALTVAVLAGSREDQAFRLRSAPFASGQRAVSPPSRAAAFGTGQFPGQRFGPLERPESTNLEPGQVPYDGRFVFARLRYTEAVSLDELGQQRFFGRRGGGMGPPWSHDYPRAERNFMKILHDITTIDPYTGSAGGAIVEIGSPDLFNYPVSYMCEPGFWTQTDQEAANLRAYLLKGGFIIFDDFRGNDWINFEAQIRRILPDARIVDLALPHPIFHSFFDVATLDFRQYYDRGTPYFRGVYLDNDPDKRLLMVINYNNDVGEYWEWSDTGWKAIDLTNEAYKLGVNYIVYGLTH
jgi:hypothetical protein